jgi:hypothetical protein
MRGLLLFGTLKIALMEKVGKAALKITQTPMMKRGYLLRVHKAIVGDGFEERGIARGYPQSAGQGITSDELFTGMFGHTI